MVQTRKCLRRKKSVSLTFFENHPYPAGHVESSGGRAVYPACGTERRYGSQVSGTLSCLGVLVKGTDAWSPPMFPSVRSARAGSLPMRYSTPR